MMPSRIFAATLLALALALPASAQEVTFTSEDEIALQQCLEGVRDINSDDDDTDSASDLDCIGIASNACQEQPGGSSTPGIVECNQREQSWWDAQLNAHYASLQETLEPEVFTSLKKAQRAWIAYRDAKCSFLYDLWSGGTIRSVIHSSCMLEETARRTADLADALDRGN